MQHEFLFVDLDGVPGVGPALVAGHYVDPLGQQIDNFALALIAPLGPHDADVLFHFSLCNFRFNVCCLTMSAQFPRIGSLSSAYFVQCFLQDYEFLQIQRQLLVDL